MLLVPARPRPLRSVGPADRSATAVRDGEAASTVEAPSPCGIGRCRIVTTGPRTARHRWLASPIGATTGGAVAAVRPRRQSELVEATAVVEAREGEAGAGVGGGAGAGGAVGIGGWGVGGTGGGG